MWKSRWNENWQGKPKFSEKTCFSATTNSTDLTWELTVCYAVINAFLASELDGSESSELRSGRFIQWEISLSLVV
jgi:hypothetical protein